RHPRPGRHGAGTAGRLELRRDVAARARGIRCAGDGRLRLGGIGRGRRRGRGDIVGTTLAGYTGARAKAEGPDLELLTEVVRALPETAVVAEGRIHTTEQARAAAETGAFAVVVGTAITHPSTITGWF